jgi:GT2 family glycosyltransferase
VTGFVVIPTYNRVSKLKEIVDQLQAQKSSEPLQFIFVDSGSSDGSANLIQSIAKSDSRYRLVQGSQKWWWARAAQEGLSYALDQAASDDFIVFLNDDIRIEEDFFQVGSQLLGQHPKSVFGSMLKVDNGEIEVAVTRDVRDFSVYAVSNQTLPEPFEQDLISGRGAFYPASVFRAGANVRYKKLPHYLADFDLSSQAKKLGFKILGSSKLYVKSGAEFGNSHSKSRSLFWKMFATQSAYRIMSQYHFWRFESGFGKGQTTLKLIRHRLSALILQSWTRR